MRTPLFLVLAPALGLAACNGDKAGGDSGTAATCPAVDTVSDECDPLDPGKCILPYPSSYFLAEDGATETGFRLNYGAESLPLNIDGVQMNPTYWNEKDGYSTNTPMMAFFPSLDMDGPGNIHHSEVASYTNDDVTTVIIDTATGERVPHFVELDGIDPEPADQMLVLRPIQPLDYDTHYVVGIRGLVDTAGQPAAVSEGFAALRDGACSSDKDVEDQRQHFDDVVFPALEATGFGRDELQLAWDFHTNSRQDSIGRALVVRDDAVAWFGDNGPPYTIDEIEEEDCSVEGTRIAKTIWGTFNAPLYTVEDKAPTILNRDAEGMPFAEGESEAEFIVRIPCSVVASGQPAQTLQYGHGFFGDLGEVETGWLEGWANDNQFVYFATKWKGMANKDRGAIALLITEDPSEVAALPERSVQGHIEQIGVLRMVMGDFAADPEVQFPDPDGDGTFSVIDTETTPVYYGISQGSIYGAAYFALSPDLKRAVFSVGGNPYSMMFARSNNFAPFFTMFEQKFDDHRDIALITTGLLQHLWDLSEGGGYAQDFVEAPPPGYEGKTMLSQVGIGDAQVTTLSAQIQARNFQASLVAPAARPVYGMDEQTAPFTGSAFVEWDFTDITGEPDIAEPSDPETDPHDCVRKLDLAQQQVAHFLTTGEVIQPCDGVCTATRSPCTVQ